MKKLLTLIIALISLSCTGQVSSFESLEDTPKQETYYNIYVHSSNIDKIRHELSCGDGTLMWDKQENNHLSHIKEYISKLPPAWESGFAYREYISDNRNNIYRFSCTIEDGSYWKLHRKSVDGNLLSIEFDTKNTIVGEKTLWVWVEKGEIKHSLNGITSCNKKATKIKAPILKRRSSFTISTILWITGATFLVAYRTVYSTWQQNTNPPQ